MYTLRRAEERGHTNFGWLESHHSFSFGAYHDPHHMGFRGLRVINEDRVNPGAGFTEHGHKNMEIVSYVLDGALEHKDSIGSGSVILPGDVQRMSAGSGIRHSEFNPSKDKPMHFLQIWLEPEEQNIAPSYEQKSFGEELHGALRLVASRTGRNGSLSINHNGDLYAAKLNDGDDVTHEFAPGRHGWLQVARGAIELGEAELDGDILKSGDGLAISDVKRVSLKALSDAEILLFDLI